FIIAPLLSPFTVPRAPTSTLFPYTTLFRSHHEVDRRLAVAGRHERKGALAAQRRAESGVLRRRRSPGHQRPEVHEMPPVQRDLLHRPLGHCLADRYGGGVDERRRAGDSDILRE